MSDAKKYTAEDIRQYLEGRMSAREMHAFEREALNDPFLSDAIEGIRTYDDKTKFFADTEQLKKRINERVRNRGKILTLPVLWKVAAVLFVVITGVAIIVFTSQKNPITNTEIAKTEKSQPAQQKTNIPQSPVVADSPANAPQASVLSSRKEPKKEVQAPSPAVADTLPRQPSLAFEQPAIVERNESIPAEEMRKADTITMSDHETLEEVVVAAYGIQKSKRSVGYVTKTKTDSDIAANSLRKRIEPQGGWDAFENYLSTKQNQSEIDSTKKGREKISFIVAESGRPSSIRILKSVSPAHDKEVIRLINEGPSWQVINGKKRKVVLSIIF